MLYDEVPDELKRKPKKFYEQLNMVKLKQQRDRLIEELINSKFRIYTQRKKKFHGQNYYLTVKQHFTDTKFLSNTYKN